MMVLNVEVNKPLTYSNWKRWRLRRFRELDTVLTTKAAKGDLRWANRLLLVNNYFALVRTVMSFLEQNFINFGS